METKVIRKNTGSTTVIMIIMMVLLVGLGGIITYTQSLNNKDNEKIEEKNDPIANDEEPVEEVSNCEYEYAKEKYTDEEINSLIDAVEEKYTGEGSIDRSTFTVSPSNDSKYVFSFEFEYKEKQGDYVDGGIGTKKNGEWSFYSVGSIFDGEKVQQYIDSIDAACEVE